MTRTLMGKDMRDVAVEAIGVNGRICPLWERGNAFVGGKLVGSCIHQDKMLWSNIGKAWTGYKLFLMWKFDESIKVMDDFYEKLLVAPLNEEHLATLRKVCRAVIVEPGDVYVFSGAGAHMACGLGDTLNLAAYEAILNFHPANLNLFRQSNSQTHHYDCRSTRDDLDDWNEDTVYNMAEIWAIHSQSTCSTNTGSQRIMECVKEAVKELCKDEDFVYEFERHRHRKRRRTEEESFDSLVDSLMPPGQNQPQEKNITTGNGAQQPEAQEAGKSC